MRFLRFLGLTTPACLAFGLFLGMAAPAAIACPMCQAANETGEDGEIIVSTTRPKAYMYSILFMLAMPATVLTGFGIGFWRLSRRQSQQQGVLPSDPREIG